MPQISIDAVKKDFKGIHVLKSVSLDVRDQEFCVLLGPSGCGKSTLLRILAGLETETAGELSIGGRRLNGLSPGKRKIAMVFQNYAVFPHMTIAQNIGFGLRMAKEPDATVKTQVNRAASLMHIEHLLDRYAGQLSGGQRQRVAVARALAMSPDVLLMDEPLSNLDALLRLEMRTELKALLQETMTTTIYVTHDQVEAMSLADRIAVMHAGEIVQYATPMEVYDRPTTAFVGSFIGNPPMNFLPLKVAAELSSLTPPPEATRAGIRPEHFVPGQGQVAVQVRVVEALGEKQQLNGEIGADKVRLSLPNSHRICAGDKLPVSVAPEHVRWYDAKDKLLPSLVTRH
jgi:multiple sugar transport system ATP-binding protein